MTGQAGCRPTGHAGYEVGGQVAGRLGRQAADQLGVTWGATAGRTSWSGGLSRLINRLDRQAAKWAGRSQAD